jgi:uncharacterized membrane protein
MKEIMTKIAALIDVKTLITAVVLTVWAVLTLSSRDLPQEVHYLTLSVVTFFFGTKFGKQEEKNG